MEKFINGCGFYNMLTHEEFYDCNHVISFSGGRTSAYLLSKLVKIIPKEKLVVNFANTGREDEGTLRFVKECGKYFGVHINWIEFAVNDKNKRYYKKVDFETASRDGSPLRECFKWNNYIPNVTQRKCTIETKIQAMQFFLKDEVKTDKSKTIQYIGIRHDEPKRWSKSVNQFDQSGIMMCYPLVDWGISKKDVLEFWENMPFDLQVNEPFGNCDLCFLKSVKRRIAVLKERPEVAEFWIGLEIEHKKQFDINYSVKQLLKIATGKTIADLSKERENDIECNCNID